jgi:hypothetical protein
MGHDYLKKLSKDGQVGPGEGNEIVLLKRGDVVFKHLLIVSTAEANYGTQPWEQTRDSLQAGFSDSAQTQGTSMSFLDLQLPAGAGVNGFGMMFTIEPETSGRSQYQLEAFPLRGNISYTMVLITPLQGGGADQNEAQEQFFDIMRSVRVQ